MAKQQFSHRKLNCRAFSCLVLLNYRSFFRDLNFMISPISSYCFSKRSLGRRSKLYPGTVPDDDEHTYMDLGDHSLRAPPPVELKSVTGTPEGETKLTDANEKSTGMKPYKDRKR